MDGEIGNSPIRVYKVGGSLFEWPELFGRLQSLLAAEPGRPLLISGGGTAADVVRDWDRIHQLGERRAHSLAIKSLHLGEALLADGLEGACIVANRDSAEALWQSGGIPILNTEAFLADETSHGASPLPSSWNVTSDSIAAWIATRWPADLVLLKSTSPHTATSPFVDPYFGELAPHVRKIEWLNLRTGVRGQF